jgi:thiamine-phosphate pyrophosphorylase
MRTRGLYPIVDVEGVRACGLDVVEFAARVLAARPALLQLRAKALGARQTLELARALVPLCRDAGALFFVNDRPDLAVLAGADGVHVGQSDLPIEEVRRFAPALKIGVSTHDLSQLDAALAARPDYVAFGPVFPTTTKENPDPVVGINGLVRAKERATATGVPLVAIGGIDREGAAKLAPLGVLGAVIGALLPRGGDIDASTELARELERCLDVPD